MKRKITLTLMVIAFAFSNATSQCALIPIDLAERVNASDLVIEASIVDQKSFRHAENQNIYTANYLEVYKVFKGETTNDQVVLISPGGHIGEDREEVIPSIYVNNQVTGLFFLYNSTFLADQNLKNYGPYSGPQACIYYDKYDKTANDVFEDYSDINQLHSVIMAYAEQEYKSIKKLNYFISFNEKAASPLIQNITPDSTAAGISHEITITGSDFGLTQGTGDIEFKNASTGPQWVNPHSTQIKFWSDTLIIVEVPSGAGTGAIRVIQSGTGLIFGPVVKYAKLNYATLSKVLSPLHKDHNANGGMTWRMSTQYNANNGAKNAFIRAMNTWRDGSCINWENGAVTGTNKDQQDGVNIVRFADPGELEQGVLGITRPRYKDCSGSVSYINEIDLSYNPSVNWYTGTSFVPGGSHDMESVIVHELGHAHSLGHVVDEKDFMHATIGTGLSKRNLINNDIDAGLFVMKKSVESFPCGPPAMVALSGCVIPVGLSEVSDNQYFTSHPNPFSSILIFSNTSEVDVKLKAYNALGLEMAEIIVDKGNPSFNFDIPANWTNGMYIFVDVNTGQVLSKNLLNR